MPARGASGVEFPHFRMTLAAGTRLGAYEILAPVGAGGMGEVYRARDRKLDRDVAVKVLPQAVAADPDTLARFEREAKAVAALSHPNILAIFDFGTDAGVSYAVTELLEGETLRGRLDTGPIAQKQAVDYAVQIAKGLTAAHEKGIVHRDLKPDNVFVSKDGHVKILDFGLAKKVEAVAREEQTSAPTGTGHTEPGTVMGTMGYMSPEQVRGLPVDHRSDLFSFGTILYEMLSGRKAFKKDTASDTIAAILKEEPPELTQSGRNVSPALDHIVKHCLEKERDQRFQSARDVAFALSEASSPTTTSGAQLAARPAGRSRTLVVIAAVVVLAAVGFFLVGRPHQGAKGAGGVKRVAVLPFENLGAPEDDYFADGVADEIRGKLTSLPGLQVIARGSSTPYKKTTKTPKQIAEELEVGYLLSATVRWEKGAGGNRVHVSPELIEISGSGAPTSRWQQPFDAAITDVFQVQSEIATKVAQALGAALGAGEEKRLSEKPTQNLAAYDAFLKSEEIRNSGANDPASLRREIGLYEQAVALDPGFAQAWAGVSIANSLLYASSTPTPALAERARRAGEKAVALSPNRPEGYLALGSYERLVSVDYTRALEQYEKGLRLAPGDAAAFRATALAEQGLGRWDASVEHFKQAVRLDPRSAGIAVGPWRCASASEALFRSTRGLRPWSGSCANHHESDRDQGHDLPRRGRPRRCPSRAQGRAQGRRAHRARGLPRDLPGSRLGPRRGERELLLRLTPSAFDDDRGTWALCLVQAYALKGDAANVRTHAEEARKALEEQLRAGAQ